MTIHYLNGEQSALFRPLTISNGKITLTHRIVHAPLTRNRGVPLNPVSTSDNPNRIWVPGDLVVEYYAQRATEGGLLISEGIPPSLEVTSLPPFLRFPSNLPSNPTRAMACQASQASSTPNKPQAGRKSSTPSTQREATSSANSGTPAAQQSPK